MRRGERVGGDARPAQRHVRGEVAVTPKAQPCEARGPGGAGSRQEGAHGGGEDFAGRHVSPKTRRTVSASRAAASSAARAPAVGSAVAAPSCGHSSAATLTSAPSFAGS